MPTPSAAAGGEADAIASRLFVPGRLCLFGEHADWAAGYRSVDPEVAPGHCLVVGTDQGISGEAEAQRDFLEITSQLPGGSVRGPERVPATADALGEAARAGGFFAYAAGVAAEVVTRYGARGLRLRLRADLPVAVGLSSSAALSVLVARGFSEVYDLGLSTREEMELAYHGERRTGSECGRMDQICAYGRRPTFLCFDGDRLDVEVLEPGGLFHFLVVDLRRGKDTRRILTDLNACFPATEGALARGVRRALGPDNSALVRNARTALIAGDQAAVGALMGEAQARFDRWLAPACPELRAPRLHDVLEHPAVAELAHGGKGVGSQGDGCAQLLAHGPAARDALSVALERAFGVVCFPVTLG